MKTTNMLIMIIVILLFAFFIISYHIYKEPKVEVGQIWRYDIDINNPFNPMLPKLYHVVAIEDNYVQYRTSDDTSSCRIYEFKNNYTLIQK